MGLAFPLINGNKFDFSSVEVRVNGVPFGGVKALDYTDTLEPGDVYSAGAAMRIGRTRGQYKAEGSLEMYKDDADKMMTALAAQGMGGFMEANFIVNADFSELPGAGIQVDVLSGCRVKKTSSTHQQGSDALTVKFDLDILYIIRNGKAPLSVPQMLK